MADDQAAQYKTQISLQSLDRRIMVNIRADSVTDCMSKIQEGYGEEFANQLDLEIRRSVNGAVSDQQAQANLEGQGMTPAPVQQAPQPAPQAGNPKGYMEPCATCGTPKSVIQNGKFGTFANCPNWPSHRGKV